MPGRCGADPDEDLFLSIGHLTSIESPNDSEASKAHIYAGIEDLRDSHDDDTYFADVVSDMSSSGQEDEFWYPGDICQDCAGEGEVPNLQYAFGLHGLDDDDEEDDGKEEERENEETDERIDTNDDDWETRSEDINDICEEVWKKRDHIKKNKLAAAAKEEAADARKAIRRTDLSLKLAVERQSFSSMQAKFRCGCESKNCIGLIPPVTSEEFRESFWGPKGPEHYPTSTDRRYRFREHIERARQNARKGAKTDVALTARKSLVFYIDRFMV